MLPKVVLLCAALYCAYAQDNEDFLEVDISGQGRVRGFRAPGTDVYTFFSIPYATAPIGEHRYKAPLPPPAWNETLVANNINIVCPQMPLATSMSGLVMQDDCLVANVYVPDTPKTNLSVLVMVHGGGFQLGFGNQDSLNNLVNSQRVVAVTFNYRLGIHGFLCLGNEYAPGNAGFKDQVALLRWVRENIAAFGGNPDDVTVAGCSAGGNSVSLLTLSKMTDGLMHKAMPESGSSLGALPIQFDPLQNAKDHALMMNFTDVDNIEALTQFYKGLSIDDLLQDFGYLQEKDSSMGFTACVERDIGQERFLEDAPVNILRNKDRKILPAFVGFANLEGVFRYLLFDEWQDLMNENFADFLPADLKFESESERADIAIAIKEFYFGNETVSTLLPYFNYFSDVLFVQPILLSARLEAQAGNEHVYLHEYSFSRSDRPIEPSGEIQGAGHCDQYFAVVDEGDESILPADYQEMKAIMRELWLNFIEYGNPTPPGRNDSLPAWAPAGENNSPHYALGQIVEIGGIPAENRTLFWDAIYAKYMRTPKAPSTSAAHNNYISITLLGSMTLVLSLFTFV